MQLVTIAEEFRGPPSSGNGGYVAGLLGERLLHELEAASDQAPEVTLRAPIPLDTPLSVEHSARGLQLLHGATLVAEAVLAPLAMDVPAPPSWDDALAVQARSASFVRALHPILQEERLGAHPVCFCCGAELPEGLGLRVHAAPLPAAKQVVAAWRAPQAYAAPSGVLPPEIIGAALDCPGQFAWLAEGTRTGLLGRLTLKIERPVHAGERCVITGWTMGAEGKKHYAGTALFDAGGQRCAHAKAVWIGRY